MTRNKTMSNYMCILAVKIFLTCALIQGLFLDNAFPEAAKIQGNGVTVRKGIIILVEFSDVNHSIKKDQVYERFNEHLNNYVKQMSYDKFYFKFDVTEKWYKMPDSIKKYNISEKNLKVDDSRVRKLIDDAVNAADEEVDFSQYSLAVIFMGAKILEYGMIGLCGYPGMLGWKTKDILKTRSGEIIKEGVAIYTYQAHVGTLFHDIAHIIGGVKEGKRLVPCLYDHVLQAQPGPRRETSVAAMINMGFWDPMSCHFYKQELPPPGISSWTKMRLNWIRQSQIKVINPKENSEFVLGPLGDGSSKNLVAKIPLTQTTYYLIENRQPIGPDNNLPGSGVLIMYADDKISECHHGRAPVKLVDANPSVPNLEGAAFNIGGKDSFQSKEHNIQIKLMKKVGDSYRIVVSPL